MCLSLMSPTLVQPWCIFCMSHSSMCYSATVTYICATPRRLAQNASILICVVFSYTSSYHPQATALARDVFIILIDALTALSITDITATSEPFHGNVRLLP
ncbi:uncharacterized protein EDB93DRAFT_33489 [Suillus bovinus]|uniref:uncharacterized protein n=1 Tax=Suillus bovinus TaxID=48563 RepID=UPI001B8861B8|nr:uncharacterized protein EDB93DRAFT_33489 [Suillus bovinus]KAG2160004.1 hypothetical protein EDB93DRAFT_33489 [Suillus bovinus]